MAGFGPTASAPTASGPQADGIPSANLALSTSAPSVSYAHFIEVLSGNLALSTSAPSASYVVLSAPVSTNLVLSSFAPDVNFSFFIAPAAANLALSASDPIVVSPVSLGPASANLTLSATSPTVLVSTGITLLSANLSLSTFIPAIIGAANTDVPSADLALSALAPVVTVFSANPSLSPSAANLILSSLAPVVSRTNIASPSCCEDPVIIDPTIIALLEQKSLRVAHLVQLDFLTTPAYLWNGNYDLTAGGHTWVGLHKLASIEGLEEEASLSSEQLKFKISGVDLPIIALAIDDDRSQYVGRVVTVWILFFDENWQPIGTPIARAAGIMDGISIMRQRADDGSAFRTLTLTAENILYGRGAPPFSYYTDVDQQLRSPGDRGMEFTTEIQNIVTRIPW